MLGEFDFSDEKLQDTIGVLPPKKQTEIIPKKLGGAKLMILMPFQKDIENPTTDYVPLSRWGRQSGLARTCPPWRLPPSFPQREREQHSRLEDMHPTAID